MLEISKSKQGVISFIRPIGNWQKPRVIEFRTVIAPWGWGVIGRVPDAPGERNSTFLGESNAPCLDWGNSYLSNYAPQTRLRSIYFTTGKFYPQNKLTF